MPTTSFAGGLLLRLLLTARLVVGDVALSSVGARRRRRLALLRCGAPSDSAATLEVRSGQLADKLLHLADRARICRCCCTPGGARAGEGRRRGRGGLAALERRSREWRGSIPVAECVGDQRGRIEGRGRGGGGGGGEEGHAEGGCHLVVEKDREKAEMSGRRFGCSSK